MKTIAGGIALLALAVLIGCKDPQADDPCAANAVVATQSDWDTFRGCAAIGGDLTIRSPGVTSLDGEAAIAVVHGNLLVVGNTALESLHLPLLTAVDGNLIVGDTGSRRTTTWISLPKLERVGGLVMANAEAEDGLLLEVNALTSVGGDLILENFNIGVGMPSLASVGGSLHFRGCSYVGLGPLHLGGDVEFVGNELGGGSLSGALSGVDGALIVHDAAVDLADLEQVHEMRIDGAAGGVYLPKLRRADLFMVSKTDLYALALPSLSDTCLHATHNVHLHTLELPALVNQPRCELDERIGFGTGDDESSGGSGLTITDAPALASLALPALISTEPDALGRGIEIAGTGLDLLSLPAFDSGVVWVHGNPALREIDTPALGCQWLVAEDDAMLSVVRCATSLLRPEALR